MNPEGRKLARQHRDARSMSVVNSSAMSFGVVHAAFSGMYLPPLVAKADRLLRDAGRHFADRAYVAKLASKRRRIVSGGNLAARFENGTA
jgi:hypothetical protein